MDAIAGLLPYALILLCPVLMLFMHGSHDRGRPHAERQAGKTDPESDSAPGMR